MKKIKVETLQVGMVFSENVYMDQGNILVRANVPLPESDLERLAKWNISEVETAGEILRVETKSDPLRPNNTQVLENLNALYANIVQNHQEVEQEYKNMLEVLRTEFTKLKNSGKMDVGRVKMVVREILDGLISRRPVFLNMIMASVEHNYVYTHTLNATILALLLGIHLHYDEKQLVDLGMSSLVHDFGMLFLPPPVLHAQNKLEQRDFETMKTHTLYGYKVLTQDLDFDPVVADPALQHHENYDGSGYPRGMKGKDISEFTRIIVICDVYAALLVDKEYRKKYTPYHALREVIRETNRRYDPDLVKEFVLALSLYPVGTIVLLNNGAKAIVVEANPQSKLKPFIKMLVNETGDNLVKRSLLVNLENRKDLFIKSVITEEELGFKLKNEFK